VLRKRLLLATNQGLENSFIEPLKQVAFAGVRAGQSRVGPNAQQISIFLRHEDPARAIQPSTTGNLVKCDYVLTVHCSMEGCTCGSQVP